jgi:hypothetical protein
MRHEPKGESKMQRWVLISAIGCFVLALSGNGLPVPEAGPSISSAEAASTLGDLSEFRKIVVDEQVAKLFEFLPESSRSI